MDFNEKKIKAIIVLEILGKPKEFVSQSLANVINQIRGEPKISVINSSVNEPTELKEKNGLFSTFAEVELETENLHSLIVLMFKYMPAHIEIISPSKYSITNNELSEILTDLMLRLHSYENIARILQSEKGILEKRLRELLVKNQEKSIQNEEDEKIKDESKENENNKNEKKETSSNLKNKKSKNKKKKTQ
jgi:hypothetical protein